MGNYVDAVTASDYRRTAGFTALFVLVVSVVSLALGLMLAVSADPVLRGRSPYKTLLMWVYAIAPPVAGLIGGDAFSTSTIGPLVDFAAPLFGWNNADRGELLGHRHRDDGGRDLEAGALLLHLLSLGPPVDSELREGGRRHRLPVGNPSVLVDHLFRFSRRRRSSF